MWPAAKKIWPPLTCCILGHQKHNTQTKWQSSNKRKKCRNGSDLISFEEERVPDVEVRLDGEGVDEDAEEPVEGEERGVDAVLLEVGAQVRKLFAEDFLQNFLKNV